MSRDACVCEFYWDCIKCEKSCNGKRARIYVSSQQALWKLIVLTLTFGISVVASLIDAKSCYVTILVQSCNNIYDFAPSTDNVKYNEIVKRESIIVIFMALLSTILAVTGLLNIYEFTNHMLIRLIGIFGTALPMAVLYYDYKMNIEKENLEVCE